MRSAAEALIEIERQLLALGLPAVCTWRFFPYPDPEHRLCLACVEFGGGDEIQMLFELAAPISDVDNFDDRAEDAIAAQFFSTPSTAVH